MSGRDRDKYRSHPLGHQKRIKKMAKEEFLNKQREKIERHENPCYYLSETMEILPSTSKNKVHFPVDVPVEETLKITYDRTNIQHEHPAYFLSETMEISTSPSKLIKLSHTPEEENHSSTAENKNHFPVDDSIDATFKINSRRIDIQEIDLRDPASWIEGLSQHLRDEIIKIGPVRVNNIDYPLHTIQKTSRKFSDKYYYRTLSNGEIVNRQWLVYSTSKNLTFCYCCKLFPSSDLRQSQLATNGTNDLKYMSDNLKVHERSKPHIIAAQKWIELKTRISKSQTIDKVQQIAIEKEKTHWKNVMIRIISVIHYLAKHNGSFRGSTDVLYEKNNGKFLGLIEMLGKFDPIIIEHLQRIKNKETHIHYLGHDIQNDLIEVMAKEVQKTIIQTIKLAKYYAIIMDCTPDTSRQEQLSIVIRIVDMDIENESTEPRIKGYFLDFTNIHDSTGLYLSDVLVEKLKIYGISLNDCRAQDYDNGANMIGQYKGVQARILKQNPRAFFMPCAAHRLNLVLGDTAKSSVRAVHFFGTVERLYTLFSASTGRWDIFSKHCHKWTVKKWSEKRWESRYDSIKAIRFQVKEIIDALDEISDETRDPLIRSETNSLISEIRSLEVLMSLCIWYTVLCEVNIVSKSLQGPDVNLDISSELLNGLIKFLTNYREIGFNTAKSEAKILNMDLKVSNEFKIPRYRKKKTMFAYEGNDELLQDPEEDFRCSYFLVLMDGAIGSITRRLKPHEQLKANCMDLALYLQSGDEKDICANDLIEKLLICQNIVHKSVTPIEVLNFIKKSNGAFPNLAIALRIMLTIPITSASAERSFSKLKLIKTYLRSTMSQERLSGLALLAIEKEESENLNYDKVIEDFAVKKSRKIKFK
ncbi:zinc finger MYM-type protein 1-like [Melanaphis sacchari]|uniref:zinc finger MYM-type protein 1-like n=1 Tax=Melanaphis sacchari TaxID=742174 RepID=UPI000DC12F6A|nr:zinc finger MYM-type protein 1-like [Melanaphis sacchari]